MNRFFALLLPVLLAGCSTTSTRPEDAGIDAVATPPEDTAADAYTSPWALPDSRTDPDAFEPDAFNVPGEGCNGLDDDLDGRIDESSCGGDFVCTDGVECECPPNTFDCEFDIGLTCEVRDATREHCGGCMPCDPSEDCSTEGGAPHCVPARILDFSAASETSGITCIVRAQDGRLVCRGFGADRVIRDSIGWTDMGVRATAVRTWASTDSAGAGTVALCIAVDERVHCLDWNVFGEPLPGGWYRMPGIYFSDSDYDIFSIEGGQGLVVSYPEGWAWGAPADFRVRRLVPLPYVGADGTRPFVITRADPPNHYELRTWGEPFPSLSAHAWTDLPDPDRLLVVRTVPTGYGDDPTDVFCYHDYCCLDFQPIFSGPTRRMQCWGGPGADVSPVEINVERFGNSSRPRLFPTPSGVRMCIENYCMDLSRLHEPAPPSGIVLELDPSISARGVTRTDWRADCVDDYVGGFACTGMHSGWPIP